MAKVKAPVTETTKASKKASTKPAVETTAEQSSTSKVEVAAAIVQRAYASYADDVSAAKASGADVKTLVSPRQRAINEIREQLFPEEQSRTACNTYFTLGFTRLLENLNQEGKSALERGKQVYSVFKLHTMGGVTKISRTVLATSKAKAVEMVRVYQMDGYEAGNIEVGTVKTKAA